jgi:serine/threonine protein phosphatase PrpC
MVSVSSRRKPIRRSPVIEPPPWWVEGAALTDRGQVRDHNEDSVYLEPTTSPEARARGILCVVADGVGGYAAGEVASRLAVQSVRDRYYGSASTFISDALRSAIEAGNLEVWQHAQRQPETNGMGSTLTGAVILGNDLVVGHVGDSRAYLIRDSGIAQVTRDHSWVEEQVQSGALSREQANRHPQRNVILRALGARSAVTVDIFQEKVLDGDVIVLCSDGLYTVVSDDEIGRIALDSPPDQAARALVALANQRGGPDNITAAVMRVHGPRASWLTRKRRWWPLAAGGAAILAVALISAVFAARALSPDGPPATPLPATATPLPAASAIGPLVPTPGPTATVSSTAAPAVPVASATSTVAVAIGTPRVVGTPASNLKPDDPAHVGPSGANLRSDHDPNSRLIDTLKPGDAVVVQEVELKGVVPDSETNSDATWFKVHVVVSKLDGWVYGPLLVPGPPPTPATGPTGTPAASGAATVRTTAPATVRTTPLATVGTTPTPGTPTPGTPTPTVAARGTPPRTPAQGP